jgi:hypothetical protein
MSPVGNPYTDTETDCVAYPVPTKEQAVYLQKLSWKIWLEFGGDDSGRGYVIRKNQINQQ